MWSRLTQLGLALLIGVYTLASLYTTIEGHAVELGLAAPAQGSLHMKVQPDPQLPRYWLRVVEVAPDTMAAQDIRPGDAIRLDRPLAYKRAAFVGDQRGLTIERDGARRHLTAVMLPAQEGARDPGDIARSILFLIGSLAIGGVGLLVLWKRWGNPAAMCLGLILLGMGIGNDSIPRWSPSAAFDAAYYAAASIGGLAIGLVPALFYYLCGDARKAWQRPLVVGWFIVSALLLTGGTASIIGQFASASLLLRPAFTAAVTWVLGLLIACVIVVSNHPRLDAAQRNRIRYIVAAIFFFVAAGVVGTARFLQAIPPVAGQVSTWLQFLLLLLAVALLAYSMIRHRLFDFGFAVNRTLVFGSMSFLLLATFGLLEWGAEHFVPAAWHEGGPIISAAVALGLFLAFHRLRDWIERHVERLFFGSWHRAETALRRFVDSAGHFDSLPALCHAFTEHLSRYAGGADALLYLLDAEGSYRRVAGVAGSGLDAEPGYEDDPAFALMRAERQPIELGPGVGRLPGALALPMLDQGTLIGFALLAPKPGAGHYRPDEWHNLAWAAQQIALDIQALEARNLKLELAGLRASQASMSEANAMLRDERERLMALLEKAQAALGRG